MRAISTRKVGRKESLDSFTPLMNHVIDYNVWAVKADSPFKTVKDVVDAAKKTPDSVTVTAYGAGSDDHLAILGDRGRDRHQFVVVHSSAPPRPRPQALGGHMHVLGANVSEVAEEVRADSSACSASWRRSARASSRCADVQGAGLQSGVVGLAWHRGARRLPKDVEAKLTAALEEVLNSTRTPGQGRRAQPRAAADQGRRLSGVPEGQRGRHQAADGVVSGLTGTF